MRRPGVLAVLLLFACSSAGVRADDKPLSEAQIELLELMSRLQVASAACSLTVDTKVLGLAARGEGLTLQSEPEKKLIADTIAEARSRYTPQKRGVECLSVFDEYGPNGTRLKGLLSKR